MAGPRRTLGMTAPRGTSWHGSPSSGERRSARAGRGRHPGPRASRRQRWRTTCWSATSPAAGATVAEAPDALELEFTGEPLPLGTLVAVTGPDGAPVSSGEAEIRGTTVVQPIDDDLPAGAYRVEWRSTSSDGHPLSGTFDFTVTEGDAAPPRPATSPAPADAASASRIGRGRGRSRASPPSGRPRVPSSSWGSVPWS